MAVETIAFDYGQRHRVELQCRESVIDAIEREFPQWADRLGVHHLLNIASLAEVTDTALTQKVAISIGEKGLPNTFVPGRNLLFLTFAAIVAYRRGLRHIVGGMCETDFSGYPDCRDDTIKAMQLALNLGMESRFILETPLMWLDKADTWRLAATLGGAPLIDIIRQHSHTCYLGERHPLHAWGCGCGECPACQLRASGYHQFIAGTS
ncbi:MAG: 7-cyano-7-deazaguanine synthase QueC [Rhodospirillales bacterium]|nr:7-cyano-7-deazaguanine synthase QueC [Rhodospirillales bacterium]